MKGIEMEKACRSAFEKFKKMNKPEFADIQAKLEWVIVSYNNDKNPVGLFEIGAQAHELLLKAKEKNKRIVSKKLIEEIEEALLTQSN